MRSSPAGCQRVEQRRMIDEVLGVGIGRRIVVGPGIIADIRIAAFTRQQELAGQRGSRGDAIQVQQRIVRRSGISQRTTIGGLAVGTIAPLLAPRAGKQVGQVPQRHGTGQADFPRAEAVAGGVSVARRADVAVRVQVQLAVQVDDQRREQRLVLLAVGDHRRKAEVHPVAVVLVVLLDRPGVVDGSRRVLQVLDVAAAVGVQSQGGGVGRIVPGRVRLQGVVTASAQPGPAERLQQHFPVGVDRAQVNIVVIRIGVRDIAGDKGIGLGCLVVVRVPSRSGSRMKPSVG